MKVLQVKFGLLLLLTMLIGHHGSAQSYNNEVAAKIDLDVNADFITITGSALNRTQIAQSLRYVLTVFKMNPVTGNRSKNDQSGHFVLRAGEKQNLSKTTVNADNTRTIILLLVYNVEDKLLGKDRVVLNDDSEEKKVVIRKEDIQNNDVNDAFSNSDGVELRGFVIEETKTKPGRDFYTYFYTAYRNNNVNGRKIVKIKEALAIANNTKLEVWVGDDLVLEFFVRPQNDYIRAMADEALKRVIRYFDNLEKNKNIVQRY